VTKVFPPFFFLGVLGALAHFGVSHFFPMTNAKQSRMLMRYAEQLLHNGWTVRAVGDLVKSRVKLRTFPPATVPGCIHTDLLRPAKIPVRISISNEYKLQWIGRTIGISTTFDADASCSITSGSIWLLMDWIPS